MTNLQWQKLDPATVAWQQDDAGEMRQIADELTQVRVDSSPRDVAGGHLLLVHSGTVQTGRGLLKMGDLLWVAHGESCILTAEDKNLVSLLKIENQQGPASSLVVDSSEIPWQEFEDPAGRPTQPVQVLLEGDVAILRTRFVPEYSAAEHWHDFDTWYFITDGSMRFGHEGWYETGQVRRVKGGYSYGPEEPGEQGVEFVLVSVGGPVNLHWADLEPAPNGPLP